MDDFGDFVIVRSDGSPVYNFVVVVDDALTGVSHVIRGKTTFQTHLSKYSYTEHWALKFPSLPTCL